MCNPLRRENSKCGGLFGGLLLGLGLFWSGCALEDGSQKFRFGNAVPLAQVVVADDFRWSTVRPVQANIQVDPVMLKEAGGGRIEFRSPDTGAVIYEGPMARHGIAKIGLPVAIHLSKLEVSVSGNGRVLAQGPVSIQDGHMQHQF